VRGKSDKQDVPGPYQENTEWVIAAILIHTRLDEDTGSYKASHSSSLSRRVERWKSKKRTDGSAISGKGLGVILARKHEIAGWCL
jgi:hypothetical protein